MFRQEVSAWGLVSRTKNVAAKGFRLGRVLVRAMCSVYCVGSLKSVGCCLAWEWHEMKWDKSVSQPAQGAWRGHTDICIVRSLIT